MGTYTITDPGYSADFKYPHNMILFQDYRLSKSGKYFWYPQQETIDPDTGATTFTDEQPPIEVTPEKLKLWNKLRGA